MAVAIDCVTAQSVAEITDMMTGRGKMPELVRCKNRPIVRNDGGYFGTWIPVTERLPNHDEYIKNNGLFNVSDGDRSYSEWFDIYDKQMFGEPTISGFRVDYAVIAWTPLPDPYDPYERKEE